MTRQTKSRAIQRLQKSLNTISELKKLQHGSAEFKKWNRATRIAVDNVFGSESQHSKEFASIKYIPSGYEILAATTDDDLERMNQRAYFQGLDSASILLSSMIDEIDEYWEDSSQTSPLSVQETESPTSNEVFVVHGRDEGAKDTLARFLERLGLQPVVLAELPSQGLTIIEKFERHAQVAFAVVLMTPDDTGSLQGGSDSSRPRARQNVIFEMGFFIGRLGRDRVCSLTKGDVEIPSDYSGVVYIPYDDYGGWQARLIGEFQAAGLDVDANRAIGQ